MTYAKSGKFAKRAGIELARDARKRTETGYVNQCDHNHATSGEVRILPYGGGGNLIVCRAHYEAEMRFRRERIAAGVTFELPEWESLEVYSGSV